jgi:hypothetical protein
MQDRFSPGYALPAAAALGPIALGAVIGSHLGPWTAAREAVLIPALIVGLTAVTVPALYIAMVATGSRLTAPGLARAVARGLEAIGIALLGLAGPLAFVLATAPVPRLGVLAGAAGLAVAALLGIQRVRVAIRTDAGGAASPIDSGLFLAWAAIALILGASLYFDLVPVTREVP